MASDKAPEQPAPRTAHASCVAIGETGILIRGPSGSGKSALALRLILDGPRSLEPAVLVADDRVVITTAHGILRASPPPLLAGLIEARGLGIRRLPYRPTVALSVVVDLTGSAPEGAGLPQRMPEPEARTILLHGHSLRRIWAPDGQAGALLLAALLVSNDYEN